MEEIKLKFSFEKSGISKKARMLHEADQVEIEESKDLGHQIV